MRSVTGSVFVFQTDEGGVSEWYGFSEHIIAHATITRLPPEIEVGDVVRWHADLECGDLEYEVIAKHGPATWIYSKFDDVFDTAEVSDLTLISKDSNK